MKLVQTAMAMESLTKIRTMNVNARPCGGLGFISDDDDDHEEVIKHRAICPTAWEANQERHSVRIAIDPADAERCLRRRIAGRQRRREALA